MKFLFITDNKIKGFGGGSLGSRKYYDALQNYCDKYGHDLAVISLDNDLEQRFPIEIYKTRKIDILARLKKHSTYLYYVLNGHLKDIAEYRPDFVFLGRTRLGFVAKYLKSVLPNIKIVTFVENVEWDYVDSYFSQKKSHFRKLEKWLEKNVVQRDESDSMIFSDKLIYLTKRDYLRMQELYGNKEKDPIILPVCLPHEQKLVLNTSMKNILFIGSLNYEANIIAIEQFVQKIWKPFFRTNKSIRLTIAGGNPTKKVKQLVNEAPNITVLQNFNDVKDFAPRNSLMIAPIAKGAGMKVKVADTLSMGLMIAASNEALVGYEEAIQDDQLNGIIRANTVDEYNKALCTYIDASSEELNHIGRQNMNIFNQYYSFNRSRKVIEETIKNMFK